MVEIGRIIRRYLMAYTVAQRILICCYAAACLVLVGLTGWAVAALLPTIR